jgi:hypothetical protein
VGGCGVDSPGSGERLVADSGACGDEPSVSGATELVRKRWRQKSGRSLARKYQTALFEGRPQFYVRSSVETLVTLHFLSCISGAGGCCNITKF